MSTMQPAYHAVTARQTLHRPIVPPEPSAPTKVTWPPSVRQYVQRAFEADNAIRGIEHSELQQKLKTVITGAAESGYLHTIDWSTYPLPQQIIMQEREQAALYGAQDAARTNIASSPPPSGDVYNQESVANGRKRKSPDTEWTQAEEQDNTPPWKKKAGKNGLEARITGKAKNQDKKQKKIDAMRANAMEVDPQVLERRKQRFGYVTPEPSPYVSSRDDSPAPRAGPLVGTCQKLEKDYFRLTAPPAPDTVRPPEVLEKSLDLIRRKWKKEHDYGYACNQLKSVRQDLTVQHVQSEFTVQVYESHARIALEMADLGEYNQCQTQLRALYRMNLGGKPEEFIAYRILYYIYTCNRTDLNDVLADLTPADKQRPGVRHALKVRSALASGNYHRFFKLFDETPFMGGYILDMFVNRERLAALAAICRAYKPDISLSFLAKELAFHGDNEDDASDPDAGARQCLDFICQSGGEHLIERKEDGEIRFLAGKAGPLFENARAAAFRGVDIKGQI